MTSWSTPAMARVAAVVDAVDRVFGAQSRALVATWGLFLTFVAVTAHTLLGGLVAGTFAIDLRIYRAAAQATLQGGDPWSGPMGMTFAAPPPTLLAYLPAALLPEQAAIGLYLAVSVAAALLAVRALRLPLWWLLFPPISESVMVLNPDVIIIGLLVGLPRLAGLSVVFKVYAAVPLLLTGRWRQLATGSLLCLLSVPLLSTYLSALSTVTLTLSVQSGGGLSAWGTWLMVPTVLALAALWRRGAEWLAVPALWPYTQLHYAAIALPVAARSAVVAYALCFPTEFAAPIATIYYAVFLLVRDRLASYRAVTSTEPSSST